MIIETRGEMFKRDYPELTSYRKKRMFPSMVDMTYIQLLVPVHHTQQPPTSLHLTKTTNISRVQLCKQASLRHLHRWTIQTIVVSWHGKSYPPIRSRPCTPNLFCLPTALIDIMARHPGSWCRHVSSEILLTLSSVSRLVFPPVFSRSFNIPRPDAMVPLT